MAASLSGGSLLHHTKVDSRKRRTASRHTIASYHVKGRAGLLTRHISPAGVKYFTQFQLR